MRGLLRRWRLRTHDRRDINCIRWDQPRNLRGAACPPCRESGGYVAQRHAQIDRGEQ